MIDRPGHADRHRQLPDEHLPGHGRDDDEDGYSPIFNESLDFSCVIFDPEGQMLAQAEFCPSQIGTIKFTVTWTIAELGVDGLRAGRRRPPQRPVPRLRPRPRAHAAEAGLLGGRALRVRRQRRAHVGDRGEDARRPFAATRPRSSRRACCCRRSRSSAAARTSRTSGRSSSPTTARLGSPTATSGR